VSQVLEGLRARFAGRRVALVHDWLTGMRGGEKVLEAIADVFPGAPIYTLLCYPEMLSPGLRSHPIHTSFLQRYPGIRSHYRHFLPLFPSAIEDFDLQGYDLVISTSHCVAKGVIPAPHARHFSYCHSPMRYAWDQEATYFPRRRGPVARLRGVLLSRLRLWDVMANSRVDHFWANSRFVAERIGRFYGRAAEVLPPPIDLAPFAAESAAARLESAAEVGDNVAIASIARRPYCLAVSALVPYKRLDLAIRACERMGVDLFIVGSGPEERQLLRLCGRHARLLGRVEDGELHGLYRGAALFLQPGIEDFGMASVEALAAGTPIVAVGRGGILDIVDDGIHGVLYQGFEVENLMRAIDKALNFRFNALKLIQRAEEFSVESFLKRLGASLDSRLSAVADPALQPTVK
jgi:glycosyltransferase involved in cell wall biosynthesis